MRRHTVIQKVIYVANTGDCAAVRGRENKKTGELQAIKVSAAFLRPFARDQDGDRAFIPSRRYNFEIDSVS